MPETSTPNWFYTYTKIIFCTKIQRFLLLKTSNSKLQLKPSNQFENPRITKGVIGKEVGMRRESDEDDGKWMILLQRSVKRIHFGSWEEKELAMKDIKRLAKQDLKRRKSMAELGVIPPLVAMVESEVVDRQRLAVQALIELSNGSFSNKALMVESGILSKLPKKVDLLDESAKQEFAELLLSISSLSNSQFPISSPRIISFLVSILESSSIIETKVLCSSTLYNLSSVLNNVGSLISNGVIDTLLKLSASEDESEKALATLGNLVVTLSGRKALESNHLVPKSLI